MNDIEGIEAIKTRVRARDPVSSIMAAERSLQFSKSQAGRILAALSILGEATARELGGHVGLELVQVARRLPDLERDLLAEPLRVGDVDVMRDGCRVWRMVEKNLQPSTTES